MVKIRCSASDRIRVPAPCRVAGSLNRTSAIRLASALRVIRRRSQRCYTSFSNTFTVCSKLLLDMAKPLGYSARVKTENQSNLNDSYFR